ncbi:MAG: acetyltransferase [Parcubacteria group bacterium GW2011_GWA2_43_11]|nr:MAG: acetyltransferase [Parcubacteria group bacterium GW2011_GWC2_42_11]KKS86404.1 MAG: acetyltransferase [Parcubacteria group bacterium GW2011_GWA2_43_11]
MYTFTLFRPEVLTTPVPCAILQSRGYTVCKLLERGASMQQSTVGQNAGLLSSFPFNRVIDTPRITLQPISREFIPDIHEGYTDKVAKFLYAQRCKKYSDTVKRIEFAIAQMEQGLQSNFQIRDNATGKFIGCANLQHSNNRPKPVFWLLEKWQRQGYGIEVFKALETYANQCLSYDFMVAVVAERNFPGIKILEKIGAKRMGHITLKKNEMGVQHTLRTYRMYNK